MPVPLRGDPTELLPARTLLPVPLPLTSPAVPCVTMTRGINFRTIRGFQRQFMNVEAWSSARLGSGCAPHEGLILWRGRGTQDSRASLGRALMGTELSLGFCWKN